MRQEEGLTKDCLLPRLLEVQGWAILQADPSGFRMVGIYAGGLDYRNHAFR